VLLAVLFTLDPKAFYGCIASILPLNAGVGLFFNGIIKKIKLAIFLKGLKRI